MEKSKGKKVTEINTDELKDNQCMIFNMGDSKGAICKEDGKITIYELDKKAK